VNHYLLVVARSLREQRSRHTVVGTSLALFQLCEIDGSAASVPFFGRTRRLVGFA